MVVLPAIDDDVAAAADDDFAAAVDATDDVAVVVAEFEVYPKQFPRKMFRLVGNYSKYSYYAWHSCSSIHHREDYHRFLK